MGVRLYNPVTGRFTSPDPIPGGNDTTYAYRADPINKYDLDGKRARKKFLGPLIRAAAAACKRYCGRAVSGIAKKAKSSWVKGRAKLRNGNSVIRIGDGRVSLGPARKHWLGMRNRSSIVKRFHVHIDRKVIAVSYHTSRRTYTKRFTPYWARR